MRKKQAGFTLLEMIITMVVAAILLGVGVPSLVNTVRTNRLASATNELTAALMYARAEAIKRNTPVALCRSSDGATCATAAGTWDIGWITYVDGNCNSSYDPAGSHPDPAGTCPASSVADTILSVHEAVQGGLTISGNNNIANQARYTSLGLNNSGMGSLTISFGGDIADLNNVRVLCIASSGRSRLMPRGSGNCPNAG